MVFMAAIDRCLGERGVAQWLVTKRMTQADVCGLRVHFPQRRAQGGRRCRHVQSLATSRCESLPVFRTPRAVLRADT
jgi:hypothetical protein